MAPWNKWVSLLVLSLAQKARADGMVIVDFDGDSDDSVSKLVAPTSSRLYARASAGRCGVFRLEMTGTPVSGAAPQRTFADLCGADLIALPDETLFTVDRANVYSRDAAGNQLVVANLGNTPNSVSGREPYIHTTLAVQLDGKILVGGALNGGALPLGWMILRLNPNGDFDTSFSGGRIAIANGNELGHVQQIVPLPLGKYLVSGSADFLTKTIVARINGDGTEDVTFGLNGTVQLLGGRGQLAVDSSGRAYVESGGFIIRLLQNGALDAGYGGGSLPSGDFKLDSLGRAVVIRGGAIARYDANGQSDLGFAGTGEVHVNFGRDFASVGSDVCLGALQPDDRIVVACHLVGPSANSGRDIGFARFNSDGTLDATFAANQADSDTYPDAFSFSVSSAPYGTAFVVSNPIAITGINSRTRVRVGSIDGRGYSIGCTGTYTTDGFVDPGQTMCVRHHASVLPGGTQNTTVNVGGRVATFTTISGNQPADTIPDAFTFVDQTNVGVTKGSNRVYAISNSVTIAGITGLANAAVQSGEYSIGCGSQFVSSTTTFTVTNGQTVCVRHATSESYGASVSTTLTINGVADTFTSTTENLAVSAGPSPTPTPPPSATMASAGGGGGGAMHPLWPASLVAFVFFRRRQRRELSEIVARPR